MGCRVDLSTVVVYATCRKPGELRDSCSIARFSRGAKWLSIHVVGSMACVRPLPCTKFLSTTTYGVQVRCTAQWPLVGSSSAPPRQLEFGFRFAQLLSLAIFVTGIAPAMAFFSGAVTSLIHPPLVWQAHCGSGPLARSTLKLLSWTDAAAWEAWGPRPSRGPDTTTTRRRF